MTKPPPPSERIRLTISVPVEVHAVFQRMAKASGQSLGVAMGDWLHDTVEAAELMTAMIEKARAAPKQVMRELNALALGYSDETGAALKAMRGATTAAAQFEALGAAAGARRAAEPLPSGRRGANPPSSNTGGKGTEKVTPKRARS